MKANEMWKNYTNDDSLEYEAWQFGVDTDLLSDLVIKGIKTATSSNYIFYEIENEAIPQVGEYSIILDSNDNAKCIIQTTKVYIVPFSQVSEEHAYKEGERNRTLEDWIDIHRNFFSNELKEIGKEFDEEMLVVCEEFKVVYKEETL